MPNKISFVIPIFNEAENINYLFNEIKEVINLLKIDYEIIFIDDGSSDDSLAILKNLSKLDNNLKYISFEFNVGQSGALYAGFQKASGDTIITLDGDLQNDPKDIINMLKFYGEYDVINGHRFNRQDSLSKKIGSKIGNFIRNTLTNENIKDTGCSLKILRANMLKKIKIYRGLHRFLPTLMRLEGAKVIEIKVNHRPRKYGISKYTNFKRAIEGFYDLIVVRWMINKNIKFKIKEEI